MSTTRLTRLSAVPALVVNPGDSTVAGHEATTNVDGSGPARTHVRLTMTAVGERFATDIMHIRAIMLPDGRGVAKPVPSA